MPLQLEQSQYGEVTVLRFFTKYFEGEADSAYLLVIIDQLLGIHKKQILLNLKDLTEIDDFALNALAEAHSKVQAAGGTIKIVNSAQRHTDLSLLSHLAPLFPSFNSEEEGIRSFSPETGQFDILEFVREMNEEDKQHHSQADEKPSNVN